jgi:hypothetical protein
MLGLVGVAVEIDRRLDVGVPELLLNEVDRFACSEPQRRRGMSKVVEAERLRASRNKAVRSPMPVEPRGPSMADIWRT